MQTLKRGDSQSHSGVKRRYTDFKTYLKERFGVRVHKIAIDAGLGCPNRDGTVSHDGCIYCNKKGSGTGAWEKGISVHQQIVIAKEQLRKRFKAEKFLVYFQSFTNTYAPKELLEALYREAISVEDVIGICIGTRPDCVPDDILDMIQRYTSEYETWIEYGLQSFHDLTLERINRGHSVAQFLDAVNRTCKRGINICVHVILGLPGENKENMIQTAQRVSELDIQGIKIHLLYVIKNTTLAKLYLTDEYKCLAQEEYIDILTEFLARLRSDIVIQRLTGDPHPEELLAPLWCLKKNETLSLLHKKLEKEDIWQGKSFIPSSLKFISSKHEP